ncbi:MAG: CRR6 family NdhI maturation factor [Cyanobacteria bacterium P01_A01_bin.135]
MSTIAVTQANIQTVDLTPAQTPIESRLSGETPTERSPVLRFDIDFSREETDPRELSEIPEVRLWFVALDARYPWLPYLLDWQSGELSRYTAMLVPHQFSKTGIQYNPEALELFVMSKVFHVVNWLKAHQGQGRNTVQLMTKTLGYELDDQFFELIGF